MNAKQSSCLTTHSGSGLCTHTVDDLLQVLGSVGEPLGAEAWHWYHEVVGDKRCAVVDTWGQTETGGILLTPLPGTAPLKPGSCGKPLFGAVPVILDPTNGRELEGPAEGVLAFKQVCITMLDTVSASSRLFHI